MSISADNAKALEDSKLRHNEYYDLQKEFDALYQRSKDNEIFDNLMDLITSPENILLAFRNIKKNGGSLTAGTDKLNINDIARIMEINDRYFLIMPFLSRYNTIIK